MAASYFKIEEKLNDASNFATWRARLDLILEENGVMKYVQGQVVEPPENANISAKSKYKKGEIKAKKIIIDPRQDRPITYVSKMKKSKEMYDKLIGMYEINNLSQIITLKSQLRDIKMNKFECITA